MIQKIQLDNRRKETYMKLLVSILKFFIKPLALQFWFWIAITLPFSIESITYLQSMILMIGINLASKL